MPEHNEGTPPVYRDLESFLWWDFDNAACWRAWASSRGYSEGRAAHCFEEAMLVQGAMRELEKGNNHLPVADTATSVLNAAIRARCLLPVIAVDAEVSIASAAVTDPVGQMLRLMLESMLDHSWTRFKICRDSECRASYFDTSRNLSKTWCTMKTCGSRNKMRRFRKRSSESSAGA